VWSVAIAGIAAWTYANTSAAKNTEDAKKFAPKNDDHNSTTKYKITGQARDEIGGLSDVHILDVNSGARTDSNHEGMFTFEVEETIKGWIRIQASKEGYETWEEYVGTKPAVCEAKWDSSTYSCIYQLHSLPCARSSLSDTEKEAALAIYAKLTSFV
jgi:hypothetical protein